MTVEFLLFKKNTAIRSYSVSGLKNIERTKKVFWRCIQICEESNLCQIFFQINPEASNCTKKLTTSQVFYVQFNDLKFDLGRVYEYETCN